MPKPKKPGDKGYQQGAQQHAEGQQGDQTHALNQEIVTKGGERTPDPEADLATFRIGKHPIHEGRDQHDEADRNADKTRLARDLEAGRGPRDDL